MKIRKGQAVSPAGWVHAGFELGLLIKAIDGILETLGGFMLLYLSPSRLNRLVFWLTRRELSEDPGDRVANMLLQFSRHFSLHAQYFGVFYLVSHGVIKLALILLLWRKKLWAYPLTIVSLVLFIGYQTYRYTLGHSSSMLVLTAFDLVMIVLTYMEYRRMKAYRGSRLNDAKIAGNRTACRS